MKWTSALGLAVLFHAAIGLLLATAQPAPLPARALAAPAPVEIDALGETAKSPPPTDPGDAPVPARRSRARAIPSSRPVAAVSAAPTQAAVASRMTATAAIPIPSAPLGIEGASPTGSGSVAAAGSAGGDLKTGAGASGKVGQAGAGASGKVGQAGAGASGNSARGGGSGVGGGRSRGADRQALIATALARIRAHRHYPELARRRGIEGTVGIAFHVAPDGEVSDLAVRHSADPALDQAALDAVRKAAPLPPLGAVEVELDFHLDEK